MFDCTSVPRVVNMAFGTCQGSTKLAGAGYKCRYGVHGCAEVQHMFSVVTDVT